MAGAAAAAPLLSLEAAPGVGDQGVAFSGLDREETFESVRGARALQSFARPAQVVVGLGDRPASRRLVEEERGRLPAALHACLELRVRLRERSRLQVRLAEIEPAGPGVGDLLSGEESPDRVRRLSAGE